MATLQPNPDRLWDLAQVKEFVKQVKGRVGEAGWQYLSHDMREALIGEKALLVAIGNGRGDVPCSAIRCLRLDMIAVAGLADN